jgi:hypothetical protein
MHSGAVYQGCRGLMRFVINWALPQVFVFQWEVLGALQTG